MPEEARKGKYVCPECGSERVAAKQWTELNTGVVNEDGGDVEYYCDQCEEDTGSGEIPGVDWVEDRRDLRDGRPPHLVIMKRDLWLKLGEELYGPDPRNWKFRCVSCGNVQSHNSVKEHGFEGDTSNWINFSCEGRHLTDRGCNWTLGGLFRIHRVEVEAEDGPHQSFEFADMDSHAMEAWLLEQEGDGDDHGQVLQPHA